MTKKPNEELLTSEPHQKITNEEAKTILISLRKLYCEFQKKKADNVCSQIKELTKNLLYACSETRRANFISQAALDKWNKCELSNKKTGKNSNLFNLTPQKQRALRQKYKNINEKQFSILKALILEHCNPLNILADTILQSNNTQKITDVLNNDLLTCWITKIRQKANEKSEDEKLGGSLRHERPGGWRRCYNEAGIKLISRPTQEQGEN